MLGSDTVLQRALKLPYSLSLLGMAMREPGTGQYAYRSSIYMYKSSGARRRQLALETYMYILLGGSMARGLNAAVWADLYDLEADIIMCMCI